MNDIKLKKQGVYLGRAGETGRKRVYLDVTAWEDEYGPGEGLMLYRNPEGKIIPMETVREEETDAHDQVSVRLYGTVGETETAVPGVGNIEVQLLSGGVVAKSDSFGTVVAYSMETGKNADEKTPKWVRQLMTDLKASRIFVDTVQEIEDVIDEYRDAAEEEMLTSEAWAVGTRNGEPVGETDPAYENSAKKHASDAEAWAVGERDGEDVDPGDEAYEYNAKKFAMDAGGSAAAAQIISREAEAWAKGTKGGVPVPSTDPAYEKSAKYYSEHAFSATPEGYETLVTNVERAISGHLVSDEVKVALLACFQNVAWATPDGQIYYDALESMLNPPANLLSITVTYTQTMTVTPFDSLNVLRSDLVVTANYADSTSQRIYGYLLTGTLMEGTCVITVTYGGETGTFSVDVTDVTLLYKLENATTFTGDNSEVINTGIALFPTEDRDLTMVMSLSPNSNPSGAFMYFSGNTSAPYNAVSCWLTNGMWQFQTGGASGAYNSNGFVDNVVNKLVLRKKKGSAFDVYIYNETSGLATGTPSIAGGITSSNPLRIGGARENSSTYKSFVGVIYECKVYARRFSDSEVNAYLGVN